MHHHQGLFGYRKIFKHRKVLAAGMMGEGRATLSSGSEEHEVMTWARGSDHAHATLRPFLKTEVVVFIAIGSATP